VIWTSLSKKALQIHSQDTTMRAGGIRIYGKHRLITVPAIDPAIALRRKNFKTQFKDLSRRPCCGEGHSRFAEELLSSLWKTAETHKHMTKLISGTLNVYLTFDLAIEHSLYLKTGNLEAALSCNDHLTDTKNWTTKPRYHLKPSLGQTHAFDCGWPHQPKTIDVLWLLHCLMNTP